MCGKKLGLAALVVAAIAATLPCAAVSADIRIIQEIDVSQYSYLHANLMPSDLDGDGQADFLFYSGTRYARAIRSDGALLWEIANPTGIQNANPQHPWIMSIWDMDGDGRNEAIIFRKKNYEPKPYLAIVNGKTGAIDAETRLWFTPSIQHWNRGLIALAHSRRARPPEIIVSSQDTGRHVAAFEYDAATKQLTKLWYRNFFITEPNNLPGHYIWPYDVDGDGRQEILLGKIVLDGDGNQLWSMDDLFEKDHVDALVCGDIDPDLPGHEIAACGASGLGLYDARGHLLWVDRNVQIPNPQQLCLGKFRREVRGLQILASQRGSEPAHLAVLFDRKGHRLGALKYAHNMQIDWDGDRTADEVLGLEQSPGIIQDGQGRILVDGSWYTQRGRNWFPYPLAMDIAGDSREEILVWGADRLLVAQNGAPNSTPAPSVRTTFEYRQRYASHYGNRATRYFDYAALGRNAGAASTPVHSSSNEAFVSGTTSRVVFHNNVIDAKEWPRVTLFYELSRPARVSIKISTRTSEPVRTLFEGERPAGRYLPPQPGTEWDGRNDNGEAVPNGMYMAEIRMPDRTYTCTLRVQR